MPGANKTSILIRVQARGGKFLADDIGGAEVTVRDAQTGEWLGGGLAQGTDSGNLSGELVPNAAQSAVVTPATAVSQPVIQWLVPDATTSAITLELPLRRPTLLAIAAYGPLGGLQSAQRVESTTWALPGQSIDQGPGFVIELPGLVVQVLSPPTHLEITSLPATITFQAKVTMMCGCQIAQDEPWVPADFVVVAAIGPVGQVPSAVVPLVYEGSPSLFKGSYQLTQTGFYQAVVSATQQSTGNLGTGTVTFYVNT
ncbi:MAG TPA: hypothetical protein VHG32_05405 [Thermoanaerobaculia bacterium]|jgi:hypothetical protein|nr:hypothetical protein [Thermoanaerobaculia bacterium]